jgi:hypothetical protein
VCAARIVITGHSRSSSGGSGGSTHSATTTTINNPTARITITDLPSDRCVETVVLTQDFSIEESQSPFWCSISSSSASSIGFRFTQPSDCSRMRAALATCLNLQVQLSPCCPTGILTLLQRLRAALEVKARSLLNRFVCMGV